jgi:hypothetical protein
MAGNCYSTCEDFGAVPFPGMTYGPLLTYAAIHGAWLLYLSALVFWLRARAQAARRAWIAGCLFYLGHVAAAFEFKHDWSHQSVYLATARQTSELFGINWGGGIYFNYLFTAVWVLDATWLWLRPDAYRRRPNWMSYAIHGYMAFLFFNATVVFGSGWARWSGIAATAALGAWRLASIRGRRVPA